jgi:hypothetical protein
MQKVTVSALPSVEPLAGAHKRKPIIADGMKSE